MNGLDWYGNITVGYDTPPAKKTKRSSHHANPQKN